MMLSVFSFLFLRTQYKKPAGRQGQAGFGKIPEAANFRCGCAAYAAASSAAAVF